MPIKMKNKKIMEHLAKIMPIASLFLLLVSCTSSKTNEVSDPIKQKNPVQEIDRLIEMYPNLELESLENIQGMVSDDHMQEELDEIKILIKYGEREHALHSLEFLRQYLETNANVVCPPHQLAHYYTFMEHGEKDRAEHSFEEAQADLNEWFRVAWEYDHHQLMNNPEYIRPKIQVFFDTVNEHIQRIKSGDLTASDSEIDFLANNASFCQGHSI